MAVLDTQRGSITRGRSLAAIRWAAAENVLPDRSNALTPSSGSRPAISLALAAFLGVLAAAANNVTLATNEMRDYIPLLGTAVAFIVLALSLAVYSAFIGRLALRLMSALLGLLLLMQLFRVSSRLLAIANGA
jgi:hypothetical protein